MDVDGGYDLRCTCSRRPMLARYGRDANGRLFVHLKVFKGRRLYAEAVFTDGTVRLHCRECLHWSVVIIRQPEQISLKQEELPPSIRSSMLADAHSA